ncbi:hypothetical protein Hanom_Chr07g00588891 [Helianthus anomalus]
MGDVFIEHGEFGFLSASSGMRKVVNEEQNAHCIYYMFISWYAYEETSAACLLTDMKKLLDTNVSHFALISLKQY